MTAFPPKRMRHLALALSLCSAAGADAAVSAVVPLDLRLYKLDAEIGQPRFPPSLLPADTSGAPAPAPAASPRPANRRRSAFERIGKKDRRCPS